jgi:hypothetical protein
MQKDFFNSIGRSRNSSATTTSPPSKRDTGRWLVYGIEVPSIPEVGAVCGKAARTDLCGGREVTRVPTAKNTATQEDWIADGGNGSKRELALQPLPACNH